MNPQEENTSFDIFPEMLRREMDQRGWTQIDLSNATGIAQGALSNYLRGKREPTAVQLHRLSSALGVTMEKLLTGQGPGAVVAAGSVETKNLKGARAEAERLARVLREAEEVAARLRVFLG